MGADDSRWRRVRALEYPAMTLDPHTWTATFEYALVGEDAPLRFTETVRFPAPERPPSAERLATLRHVLELLYVAAGTSYYKVAAPPRVVLSGVRLAGPALPWATALFHRGMAEFAYTNDLPHVLDVELTSAAASAADIGHPASAAGATVDAPPLVPVGGGKDSMVTVEALRRAGMAPVLLAVNANELHHRVVEAAGLPALTPRRTIDPRLLELNRQGAYNGHVPVTAINSLVAVATAVLHGLGPVVMSNERSASAANLTWHGRPVNHQWSKGLEAERLLREALAAHAGLPEAYFSLLRPLSELQIARLFAPFTAYDHAVTSCNAAYRITGRTAGWCGDCPKCRFVFVALAPFMPRERLVSIVGRDLLADDGQTAGYRELAGLAVHRPFECVGEVEETLAALRLISDRPEWADAAVVRRLREEVTHPRWLPDEALARVFRADGPHFAPPRYAAALEELTTAVGAVDAPC